MHGLPLIKGCSTPILAGGRGGGGGGGARGQVTVGVHTAAGLSSAGTAAAEVAITGGSDCGSVGSTEPVVRL